MKTVHRTGLAWVSVVARVGSEPHAPLALLPGGGRCNAPRKARDYTGVLVSTYGFWQSLPRTDRGQASLRMLVMAPKLFAAIRSRATRSGSLITVMVKAVACSSVCGSVRMPT